MPTWCPAGEGAVAHPAHPLQGEHSPPPSGAQASFWRLPNITPGSCTQLSTPPTLQQVLPEVFPTDQLPSLVWKCRDGSGLSLLLPCPVDLQDSRKERVGASQNSADTSQLSSMSNIPYLWWATIHCKQGHRSSAFPGPPDGRGVHPCPHPSVVQQDTEQSCHPRHPMQL